MRRLVVASAICLTLLGLIGTAPAAARDDVNLVYIPNPIPLNVDAFVANSGSRTVVALVQWESFQGNRKLGGGAKTFEVPPHSQVPVGKSRDSLTTTRFTILSASYK
jgi:hypothetical protein